MTPKIITSCLSICVLSYLLLLACLVNCLPGHSTIKNQNAFSATTTNTISQTQAQAQEQQQVTPAARLSSIGQYARQRIRYDTKWFTQRVDHFSWANQDTWQQRYLLNVEYWCGSNCPILFYCGSEDEIEVFANNTGWMWENAQQLGAMLVFAEHRFYGQSRPYKVQLKKENTTVIGKGLGYLSSDQALADYERLINELRNNLFDAKSSAVIVMGGSYGGMLAAWMRMRYPNSVLGALASSAPMVQFPGTHNCQQFHRIATQDYSDYSPYCARAIKQSWSVIDQDHDDDPVLQVEHRANLTRIFKTCKDIKTGRDVGELQELLTMIWIYTAMSDYAHETKFLAHMPAYPIEQVCKILASSPNISDNYKYNSPGEALKRNLTLLEDVSRASQIYTNYTGELQCLDMDSLLWDDDELAWDFQSCTGLAIPFCSDGVNDMFVEARFNVSVFGDQCRRKWGIEPQIGRMEQLFGGHMLESTRNIIFSTGTRDPFHSVSLRKDNPANGVHLIVIPGVCHHEDMRPSGPNDTVALRFARRRELDIVISWLEEHYAAVRAAAAANTTRVSVVWRAPLEGERS